MITTRKKERKRQTRAGRVIRVWPLLPCIFCVHHFHTIEILGTKWNQQVSIHKLLLALMQKGGTIALQMFAKSHVIQRVLHFSYSRGRNKVIKSRLNSVAFPLVLPDVNFPILTYESSKNSC